MHRAGRFRGAIGCCVLCLLSVLLVNLRALPQTSPRLERNFPTDESPRVVTANAFTVSVNSWDRHEVSVAAMGVGAPLLPDELIIKADKSRIDIACRPSKSDKRISLLLRVPAKASLEMKNNENTVEVKDLEGEFTMFGSKDFIQFSAEESATLDMRDAPNATMVKRLPQGGFVQATAGRRTTGTGRPYVRVTAPKARVAATLGAINQLSQRPPTVAAQTIARRGGLMGEALRRSNPQLVRPQHEPDAAPSPSKEDGALKLETHLVNLNVSATDKEGRAVGGLTKDAFRVFEDGVPQRVSFFSPEQSPFNLVLLIDLSGSMRDEIELIKATALHFLNVIGPQDSVAVVTFTTDVTVVSQLTKDRDDLRESIEYMLAPNGGTAFYDALGFALVETLRKVKGQRNAIVAITDGEDNAIQTEVLRLSRGLSVNQMGSFLSFEELLEGVTEADALVYPVHLDPTPTQLVAAPSVSGPPNAPTPRVQIQTNTNAQKLFSAEITEMAKGQLRSLSDATGARFYHAGRIEDLKGVFEQVAAEVRTVYSLAYTPTNTNYDGRFRRIRVQVDRPDVVARTRPGYYGR